MYSCVLLAPLLSSPLLSVPCELWIEKIEGCVCVYTHNTTFIVVVGNM
jgi:hypothetical protein